MIGWLPLGNASWAAFAAMELEVGCGSRSMKWGKEDGEVGGMGQQRETSR